MSTLHAMTIDVEDYFMVSAFERTTPKSAWDAFASRLPIGMERVMRALGDAGVKATFFTLGWVADRQPALVRSIHEAGHEVACHGYEHRLLYDLTPSEFRADLRRAKSAIENAIGAGILGFRAPSFSVVPRSAWALPIVREEGFVYDASLMPAPHARGGMPNADRAPHRRDGLAEFPMSTLQIAGRELPFSGGGYFRLFPYALIRMGMRQAERDGRPVITYLHPWEFDPEQPRMPASALDNFRHRVNLGKTEAKFRRYLSDYRFGTVEQVLRAQNLL